MLADRLSIIVLSSFASERYHSSNETFAKITGLSNSWWIHISEINTHSSLQDMLENLQVLFLTHILSSYIKNLDV